MIGERAPLVPVPAPLVRSRSRPGAILGMWAWESVVALLAAAPAIGLVRAAFGRSPDGDAALWAGGALPLMAALARDANGVRAALLAASIVLTVAVFAGLVPLSALLATLAFSAPDGRPIGAARSSERAILAFRPFVRLLLIVGIGQLLVLVASLLFGEAVQGWAGRAFGEARGQQAAIAVAALIGLAALALSVLHDLARAAVIRREVPAVHGLVLAGSALRSAPVALGWAWAWRSATSIGLLLAGGAVASGAGGRGGVALVGLWVAHQAVVLGRVVLRASWLARALRAVGQPEESER